MKGLKMRVRKIISSVLKKKSNAPKKQKLTKTTNNGGYKPLKYLKLKEIFGINIDLPF